MMLAMTRMTTTRLMMMMMVVMMLMLMTMMTSRAAPHERAPQRSNGQLSARYALQSKT